MTKKKKSNKWNPSNLIYLGANNIKNNSLFKDNNNCKELKTNNLKCNRVRRNKCHPNKLFQRVRYLKNNRNLGDKRKRLIRPMTKKLFQQNQLRRG